jgi:hypothetical protein
VKLRKHLEKQLDTSLARLRPRHAVAPIVMGLLRSGKVKAAATFGSAAGAGAKAMSGVTKGLPLKALLLNPWLTGLGSGLLFEYYTGRLEFKNFREPEGFRAQSLRYRYANSIMTLLVGLVIISWVRTIAGPVGSYYLFGCLCLFYASSIFGKRRINSGKFVVHSLYAELAILTSFLVEGVLELNGKFGMFGLAVAMIFLGLALRYEPRRRDYSLFLRLTEGLIPEDSDEGSRVKLSRETAWAFARFLGERWLVQDVRKTEDGLKLRLAPVNASARYNGFLPFIWYGASTLGIGLEGQLHIVLGKRDLSDLAWLHPWGESERENAERRVERALGDAFQAYLKGDVLEAERHLGQQPDEEIFHEKPEVSRAVRWR